MARIFITGSSDGLGLTAAQLLVEQGHRQGTLPIKSINSEPSMPSSIMLASDTASQSELSLRMAYRIFSL